MTAVFVGIIMVIVALVLLYATKRIETHSGMGVLGTVALCVGGIIIAVIIIGDKLGNYIL